MESGGEMFWTAMGFLTMDHDDDNNEMKH